jgi:hypothetical protein
MANISLAVCPAGSVGGKSSAEVAEPHQDNADLQDASHGDQDGEHINQPVRRTPRRRPDLFRVVVPLTHAPSMAGRTGGSKRATAPFRLAV